jgi:hypothetical protein
MAKSWRRQQKFGDYKTSLPVIYSRLAIAISLLAGLSNKSFMLYFHFVRYYPDSEQNVFVQNKNEQ